MKILDIKVFREIKTQKFRSILIIAIVAITLGMLIGMRAGYPMMEATYEKNLIENNMADGRFTFVNPILESNVSDIQDDVTYKNDRNIQSIEGRIIYQTQLTYDSKRFPAIVLGVHFPNRLNQVYIEDAASDINPDSDFLVNESHCIIETRFAGKFLGQDVQLDEDIALKFGNEQRDFTVKAIGQDTDFLYVVDPATQMTLLGKMAIVWVNIEILQEYLFNGFPLINQVLFTVEDRLNQDMIKDTANDLFQDFQTHQIDITVVDFTIYDETIDRQFYDADAGSIDKVGSIFGLIGLIVCAVAIYNTLSRLVQAQRRNIGLFMSMGSKPFAIIFHYVKITMILASIGVLLGLPLGYGFSIGMTKIVVRLYSLHYFAYPIVWAEYIGGTLVTLAVAILISAISAFPITRITPRKAMSGFFNRIKVSREPIAERLFKWIPGFRSLFMLVPIREITLRKKKSAFTILAITTSMIILITSVAMEANMYSAVVDNYEKYNTSDIRIKFITPIAHSDLEQFMENNFEEEVIQYEEFVYSYIKLYRGDELLTLTELEVYQTNSTLRNFNIIEGTIQSKADLTQNQIVLGSSLAGKYELDLGDEIKMASLENHTVEIGALVGELIDFSAFWTFDAFYEDNISNSFGFLPGYVNGIMLDLADDVDRDEIQAKFEAQFMVGNWIDSEEAKESALTLMESLMGVLFLFIGVGMFIGILFSFNTMYTGFLSRENDFLAFKAMGTSAKYIRKMIFWENALLSIFSLIITVPVGYLFYWWSMDYILEDRFYIPLSIPLVTWPIVFLLSMISIWLATRRMTKKIGKMVLADELRIRIVN